MKIGDVVIPRYSHVILACGSGWYTHAICTSIDPFILVSEEADMLWTRLEPDDFRALCAASEAIVTRCLGRTQNWFRERE